MPQQPQSGSDRLSAYRAKRSAEKSPEPFGGTEMSRSGIFVVQKHAASRLHYDLRLEHDGVLMSWAVPAGISVDPSVKRFAAHTEDHPLEYADFEGVIPEDEYGGGQMVVWDRGALTWDEDPDDGMTKGKLLFSLAGYKLRGQWTLVQMKKNPVEWLLIKKPDGWHRDAEEESEPDERSILTGRTVEDLARQIDATKSVSELLESHGASTGEPVDNAPLKVMLAKTVDAPFSRDGWLFEIKYDGYRLVASKDANTVTLRYRSGIDATSVFPEIASAFRMLPHERLVVDGEVVVLDDEGIPNFGLLQRRGRLSNRRDIAAAAARLPATFFGFDLLSFNDADTRNVPLLHRKEALGTVLPSLGPLRYAEHFPGIGESLFERAVAMGLEGIMAKDASSTYTTGRSDAWLKIRAEQTAEFAVVGYTLPKGGRTHIGALHIAMVVSGDLTYAGRVGSGFTEADLSELRLALDDDVIRSPKVMGPTPADDGESVWVEPRLQCTVRFKEVTDVGALRHPVFEGYRVLDVDSLYEVDDSSIRSDPPTPSVIDARTTEPTNVDKVFWPSDGFTKGDLIHYYTVVADHLLPYLADRPLVLDRFPDGIHGKSFFQKNAPAFAPEWVRTEWIGVEDKGNNYFFAEDVESLRYLANLASIPLHVWASRSSSITSPDWCILDLDPKDAPFTDVVAVAKTVKAVCDAMGLPCYPKTSGKTGLHVLIPMGHDSDFTQQKLLGELVARVVESRTPEIATTVRIPGKREGKVYIDYLQNGRGKLLVSPYSVRPVDGATVSAPLRWSEVTRSLDVTKYTIRSMPRRLASMAEDPLLAVLTERPDIRAGLAQLKASFLP